jgi:pyruvate,water dikinase
MADLPLVGGKNASLGQMYQNLASQGVRVPNGFAITTRAYRDLISAHELQPLLDSSLAPLGQASPQAEVDAVARTCHDLIYQAPLSAEVLGEIETAFDALQRQYGADLTVAVRSSATAEDLPDASFAGQHESFLHIKRESLIDACRRCFASLYTPRAIRYRLNHGIAHDSVALSVGVMKMVRADTGASGVTFTLDTDSGHPGMVYTTATLGLGELLVQGAVEPDEFYVHKDRFAAGYRRIMNRRLGSKLKKMVWTSTGVATVNTTSVEQQDYCIAESDVLILAETALKIEAHYSQLAGTSQPMDIEWARDGIDGQIYVIQARPETVASNRDHNIMVRYELDSKPPAEPAPLTGRAVGQQIASGRVRVVRTSEDLHKVEAGEVLVATTTSPDWGAVMQSAAAVVTDEGGRTCHAAIVARELGIPAVVGTQTATTVLNTGDMVTVACHTGQTGAVYAGELAFAQTTTNLDDIQRPRTKLMLNVGNPDIAFKAALLPSDGVGLARLEFIISNHVKLHPMAAIHPQRCSDDEQKQIAQLTRGHASPADFFVSTLAEGIATIAGAFFPRPVIVRLSDFKSNEYAALLGGAVFEPQESNPMLGFRGASRYAHPNYREGFALECAAFKRVREDMGFTNVQVMVPFCRRVAEGQQTLAEMAGNGLERSADFQVYLMCEIPNNVILIDEFSKHFDAFSIGSNDLTQLTLGVDRDSALVAFDFDERDPGMLEMLRMAIEGAHRNNRPIGICGQGPSDYPDLAAYLIDLGIDSISLTPDSLLSTMTAVQAIEQPLQDT